MTRILLVALAVCLLSTFAFAGTDSLVVHEWGTFTSLQDETGRAIGGINEDVEPLPPFVHDLGKSGKSIFSKGLVGTDPGVTMRLETPVVYFHPHEGAPKQLSLSIEFHGGLLSQFYPDAKTNAPAGALQPIAPGIVGSLTWNNVQLGTSAQGPKTESHVWLAPRKVDAANVTAANGESERYLFYRGVGSLDSPLKIVRGNDRLFIHAQLDPELFKSSTISFAKVWFYDLRPDGTCAFTSAGPLTATKGSSDPIGWVTSKFHDVSYSAGNLETMRGEMRGALVADGLFDDEAQAMLNTWETSYFKTPGSRIFFMVPRTWTDRVMPMKLSADAKINRVMIGRIDLVTPEHRETLAKLAETTGDMSNASVHDLYAKLGRFAGAMVRDEAIRQPSSKGLKVLAMSR